MRLICPNCDAQYEVDAGLVPPEGRDVQCSACGHVWFQSPDPFAGEDLEEIAEAAFAPEPEADTEPDTQVLRRHSLDESMLSVLREEAERETRAREGEQARATARSLEFQPDLGLPEAEERPQLRIRPRTPRPEPAPEPEDAPRPQAAAAPRNARRELLPDIEQINSTLDASSSSRRSEHGVGLPPPAARRRSGFRSGFLLMLVLAGLAAAIYAQAPRLALSVPQAKPALDGYVALVDQVRLRLDGLVQQLLNRPQG